MSKEDAITRLSEYEKQLRALQNEDLAREFARIATEESDCASHAKGGDLGWFGRGNMQKPFEVSLRRHRLVANGLFGAYGSIDRMQLSASSPVK